MAPFKPIATVKRAYPPISSASRYGRFAVLDQSSYAWTRGVNTNGQLGDNTTSNRSSPVSVVGGRQWIFIIAGTDMMVALDASSYAWAWGLNSSGQLGDGTTTNRSSPVSVQGGIQWRAITIGSSGVIGLDSNSYAWAWGSNSSGALGDNTTTNRSSPVSVVGGKQWIALANVERQDTLVLDASSYAWGWGVNTSGQLGDNTIANRSSPVSVVGDKQWLSLSNLHATGTNYHCLLDASSYAWAWGSQGSVGVLGDNTTTNRSSPVSVVGGKQWIALENGIDITVALDASSYAWAWGSAASGGTGDNTTANRSSPVSVVGDKQWRTIAAYYNGSGVRALDSLSYAWAWGVNTNGQHGDGTVANRSSPVSALILKQFDSILNVFGTLQFVKDPDNFVWCLGGNNATGQIGDGTIISRSSPVSCVSTGSGLPTNVFGVS